MSSYTDIQKPTGTPYTNINKAFLDISLYGSAIYGTSKYGVINNYTNINKPSDGLSLKAGMTVGLLMPLTNSVSTIKTAYTNVPKPT